MAATTTRTVRALFKISTRAEVARALKVSVSTVARWAKKLPANRREQVRAAYDSARKREVELKKELRGSVQGLMAAHGVSRETASRWKKSGRVSPSMRKAIDLFDAALPQEPTPRRLGTKVREFTGRISASGVEISTKVEAFLSPRLARQIINWLGAAQQWDRTRKDADKTYHITLIGDAPEEFGLAAQSRGGPKAYKAYNTVPFKGGEHPRGLKRGDLEQVVLATNSNRDIRVAIADMREQLEAADAMGLFISKLSLWVRVPR